MERAQLADLRVYLRQGDEIAPEILTEDDIVLVAKADQHGAGAANGISGLTGFGVEQLIENIVERLQARVQKIGLATHKRHVAALSGAYEALVSARTAVLGGQDRYDMAAEDIRTAVRRLDRLVGRIDVEEVLGVVFANFCIGK